jgi:hypothetical protein
VQAKKRLKGAVAGRTRALFDKAEATRHQQQETVLTRPSSGWDAGDGPEDDDDDDDAVSPEEMFRPFRA